MTRRNDHGGTPLYDQLAPWYEHHAPLQGATEPRDSYPTGSICWAPVPYAPHRFAVSPAPAWPENTDERPAGLALVPSHGPGAPPSLYKHPANRALGVSDREAILATLGKRRQVVVLGPAGTRPSRATPAPAVRLRAVRALPLYSATRLTALQLRLIQELAFENLIYLPGDDDYRVAPGFARLDQLQVLPTATLSPTNLRLTPPARAFVACCLSLLDTPHLPEDAPAKADAHLGAPGRDVRDYTLSGFRALVTAHRLRGRALAREAGHPVDTLPWEAAPRPRERPAPLRQQSLRQRKSPPTQQTTIRRQNARCGAQAPGPAAARPPSRGPGSLQATNQTPVTQARPQPCSPTAPGTARPATTTPHPRHNASGSRCPSGCTARFQPRPPRRGHHGTLHIHVAWAATCRNCRRRYTRSAST